MTDLNIIKTERLVLREAPVAELDQILAGVEPGGRPWAPGYPFGGTIGGATLLIRKRRGGAARALSAWLLSRPEVTEVVAETEHDHVPSLGVLRNVGFIQIGANSETVRFRLTGPLA